MELTSRIRSVPEGFAFSQTMKQAFYFVNSATIDDKPLDTDDLIIAYNGDIVVGARYWSGEITDVPAMGAYDMGDAVDYCESGDEITFKIFDFSTNTLVDMKSDIATTWENFGISVINLTEMRLIPSEISLGTPYPNPFNPITNISFSIPANMDVEIVVYDMRGGQVMSLTERLYEAGYHDLYWDAGHAASGIYFVKMIAGDYISTQKLMLVK
tara:strand:- start:104 stop:742 length:639 start_codon:yes stop_codon:yes gene_type:complete